MKLFVALVVAAMLLADVRSQDSAQEQRRAAAKNSAKILTDLYVTLRNIAFPKSPLSNDVAYNRFVLLSPGKVLNYWDYYPGAEYEESLMNRNSSATEALVPPAVMEKWFDLADAVVGADAFSGGTTGKSLARTYETILSGTHVLGFESRSSAAKTRYNVAHSFLTAEVQDPENITRNATRLALYERYKAQYAERRLEMEETIEHARTTRGSLDYELWFQRNFPALNSRVESAYTKWLTFGEKVLVELHTVYLDSGTGGANLGGARMSLRASGVRSLDRTRTVYPVSFEPGNWYKYLLPKRTKPTRDMLLVRKSFLESERGALETIIDYNTTGNPDARQAAATLERDVNITTEARENTTNAAIRLMMRCMRENAQETPSDGEAGTSACEELKERNGEALSAIFEQAQVRSQYQSAALFLKSKDQFNEYLEAKVTSLTREIDDIDTKLSEARPYLGEIVESRDLGTLEESSNAGKQQQQNLDDAWTQFEFDSRSSHTDTNTSRTTVEAQVNIGNGRTFDLGINVGVDQSSLAESLSKADVTVSGELLRVVIKRPWFKPSLFEDSSLSFVQRDEAQQKNTYVSPGPRTELDLMEAIGGTAENLFLMPEYTTSFLLGRNINLEFHGLDQKHVSNALRVTTGVDVSGWYKGIMLQASVGVERTKERVVADRTTNGLRITIPGAQIMGYYTNVLPQFPRTQL